MAAHLAIGLMLDVADLGRGPEPLLDDLLLAPFNSSKPERRWRCLKKNLPGRRIPPLRPARRRSWSFFAPVPLGIRLGNVWRSSTQT